MEALKEKLAQRLQLEPEIRDSLERIKSMIETVSKLCDDSADDEDEEEADRKFESNKVVIEYRKVSAKYDNLVANPYKKCINHKEQSNKLSNKETKENII